MDSDQVYTIGATLSRAVLSQDVTEYAARMSERVILNVHYTKDGTHTGAPEVPVRTLVGFNAAIQNAKDGGGGQLYPPLPPTFKDLPTNTMSTTATKPSLATLQQIPTLPVLVKSSPGTANSTATPVAPPPEDSYVPASRFNTAHDAARQTLDIFLWLGKGKFIAEPKVFTTVRRPKKDTLLAAKGASNPRGRNTGPPPTLSLAPLDREFLSVVVIAYGRPGFLVQDECYILDDGQICIIDRFLHAPPNSQDANFIKAKMSFFGLGKGKLDLINNRPPPLDFSFKGLVEPLDILRTAPGSGKVHVPKPVYKAPEEKRPLDRLQYAVSDQSKQTNRKLVVAKNRNGDEEAYEFEERPVLKGDVDDGRNQDDEELRGLVRRLENRYECEAVRLCNNNLHTAHGLVRAMHNLVANYLLTVQWLDLSNNRLTDIPDLSMLPLRTLNLHANNISDWDVVEERIAPLKHLTSITLFGNPIATTSVDYRDAALMRLLRARPKGAPALKTLDFAPISTSDAHTSKMHSQFTKGGTIPLHSIRSASSSTRGGTIGLGSTSPRSMAASTSTSPRQAPPPSSPRR